MARLRQNGFVSVLILLVITFMSYQGIKALIQVSSQERMVTYEAHKTQAAYLADSGIELAISALKADNHWQGGDLSLSTGQVSVHVEVDSLVYKVTAHGRSGQSAQTRYAELILNDAEKWVLIAYYEKYN